MTLRWSKDSTKYVLLGKNKMQIEASFPVASDVPGPQKEKHDMFLKFCSAKKVFCKDCEICAHPASSTK